MVFHYSSPNGRRQELSKCLFVFNHMLGFMCHKWEIHDKASQVKNVVRKRCKGLHWNGIRKHSKDDKEGREKEGRGMFQVDHAAHWSSWIAYLPERWWCRWESGHDDIYPSPIVNSPQGKPRARCSAEQVSLGQWLNFEKEETNRYNNKVLCKVSRFTQSLYYSRWSLWGRWKEL